MIIILAKFFIYSKSILLFLTIISFISIYSVDSLNNIDRVSVLVFINFDTLLNHRGLNYFGISTRIGLKLSFNYTLYSETYNCSLQACLFDDFML